MDLLKQAEKNVVRIARDLDDTLHIFKALENFGNKFFSSNRPEQEEFFRALRDMRHAVYIKYMELITNCFAFVGVGGTDAADYSREKFFERFGKNNYEIMSFLDRYGQIPHSYKVADEAQIREEAKAACENLTKSKRQK